jgi:hypothetical protein
MIKMRRIMILLPVYLSSLVNAQPAKTYGGEILLTLISEEGIPISGGIITLHLAQPEQKSKMQRTDWTSKTDAAGSVRITALPQGKYTTCVIVPDTNWLSPCEWNIPTPSVSITADSPTTAATILMRRGVTLTVRVDDPLQLLPQHEGKTDGAFVLIGAVSSGFVFHQMPVVSRDSKGRDQEVLIPFDTPVELLVRSSFFRINDPSGLAIGKTVSTKVPVSAPKGPQLRLSPVRLVVDGTDAQK